MSVLVNNVSYADGNELADMTVNSVHTMISVNCYSIALFTKLLIEPFKKRWKEKGKRSLIINHSASASMAPMPFCQLYSATKIYNDFITEGLKYELESNGIDVNGVRPFGLTQHNDAMLQ